MAASSRRQDAALPAPRHAVLHIASKPSHDTHELRAAYRAYGGLAEQTAPLQSWTGIASTQELAAALMGLAPAAPTLPE